VAKKVAVKKIAAMGVIAIAVVSGVSLVAGVSILHVFDASDDHETAGAFGIKADLLFVDTPDQVEREATVPPIDWGELSELAARVQLTELMRDNVGSYGVFTGDSATLRTYDLPTEMSLRRGGLPNPDNFGGVRTVQTTGRVNGDFVEVVLPVKPNGTKVWVKASDLTIRKSDVYIVVDVSDRTATLFSSHEIVGVALVAVGAEDTPTPTGIAAMVEVAWTRGESDVYLNQIYGDKVFGLNQHSEVLEAFLGGRPAIALHGTPKHSQLEPGVRLVAEP
jgi:hypothetical protein